MLSLPAEYQYIDLSKLSRHKKAEVIRTLEAMRERRHYNKLNLFYRDEGPLRRELYQRHLEFFRAGKTHQQRLFMAANRVGKTEGAGAYETTLHLTGLYPQWWPGKRFDKPTDVWAAGYTSETTRDIVQLALMGPPNDFGSGLIPKDRIIEVSTGRGIADSLDTVLIRHQSGGESLLGFKQYKQGRKAFEGTKKDVVWFDEEAGMDVYNEALLRITSAKGFEDEEIDLDAAGIVMTTFTPLEGLSELVMSFMPGEYTFKEAR